MDRRIRPHKNRLPHDARFRIAPEAAGNYFVRRLDNQFEVVTPEKLGQYFMTNVGDGEYLTQSVEICFRTIRTRSSTMASRSSSSSFALPSTSVESYV